MAAVTTTHIASWGVNPEHRRAPGNVRGVVVEWDESSENVSADELNEVGSKIGMTVYDKRYSATCVVQCAADAAAPGPGTNITVSGSDGSRRYFVKNSRITESNSNYRRISISLEGSAYSGNSGFINGVDGITVAG